MFINYNYVEIILNKITLREDIEVSLQYFHLNKRF